MFFTRSKSVDKLCIEMTREFFVHLGSTIRSEFPKEFERCNQSAEDIMEVYRHSLCLAFGLESELNAVELNKVCDRLAELLSGSISKLPFRTDEQKSGFVQGCMHCIVISRNRLKGY